jgi:hypothetical protein
VVELTHLDLNSRFDMSVVFTANYSFSGRRRPRRQQDALGDQLRKSQDQVGLCSYGYNVYVRVHRGECSYVYKYLCLYCVFKKRLSCQAWPLWTKITQTAGHMWI